MVERVYNFNPGPAMLPQPVLEKAQKELLNYEGTGMSIMEISHRSPEFEATISSARELLRELLQLPESHEVLFLQGGASLQFFMIPYNFLAAGKEANYIITGSFSKKAHQEATKVGTAHVAASTAEEEFRRIPAAGEAKLSATPAYVHITTNNTIYGTQYKETPDFGGVPLVADMSSDILSCRLDMSKFALVYAGAQKNLGPAGVTAVILDKEMLQAIPDGLPSILDYRTHLEAGSLYNTPPCFNIYIVDLVLKWIRDNGGLEAMEQKNQEKASLIYDTIDKYPQFYKGHAHPEHRSTMNITFRLPGEDLEKRFLDEAGRQGMTGLKGHRSVGGIRASIYNAMPIEGCKALAQFMEHFYNKKG